MNTFQEDQLPGALEALLFVTDEPVNVLTLAEILELDPKRVEQALMKLQRDLSEANRGVQLCEVAGGWRLMTHPLYHDIIESFVRSWDTTKLSQAALETLAIVAYAQPVTRNEISSIRGVSSDSSVNSLLEKGLLREAGVQDSPGNPTLYATSKQFLEKFGLRSKEDLPDLEQFAPDEQTRSLIAQRLSVVRNEDRSYLFTSDQAENKSQAETLQQAMQDMLQETLRPTAGVVEKINFDELVFEED